MLRKLAGIGALVVASVAAGFVGREIARLAAARWTIQTGPVVHILCSLLAWVLLFVVGRILLGYLARKLGSDQEGKPARWNRWMGALFGAVQAMALCWFVVAIVDSIPEDTRARWLSTVHEQMKTSPLVVPATHATNPAAHLELEPLIADVSAIAARPSVLRQLEDDEAARELLGSDKVRRILDDPELMSEWRKGRFGWFLAHPRVTEALEDSDVRELLRSTDLREALRRLAGKARAEEE